MQRSWYKRLVYAVLRVICRLVAVTLFRFRGRGRENIPRSGPVLVCSNHQSVLDPVIVGLSFNRRMNYLARRTLFGFGPFRWLIEFLDAIPIEREGMGLGGLKECLRRLKSGEIVLIFPEGTRTRDGNVAPIQPGFVMLARRSNVTLLPVGIDGAFDAWPRTALLPRPVVIQVQVGKPLTPDEIQQLDDRQLVAEIESRIRECHAAARRFRAV